MKAITCILLLWATSSLAAISDQLANLNDAEIKSALHKLVLASHRPISYNAANVALFTQVDNINGFVCSVYSPSFCLKTATVPSAKIMNVEHTWPQSLGANGEAKADLHHLYATTSSSNSIRSSLPFCHVEKILWQDDQSKRGLDSYGEHCFEPPKAHKGNVARALFYFAIRYNQSIEAHEEAVLRLWDKEDPVTKADLDRDAIIQKIQGNSNPFITDSHLADLIKDF